MRCAQVAVFLALLPFAGCSVNTEGLRPTCRDSSDCPAGELCLDGTCAAEVDASRPDSGTDTDGGADASTDAAPDGGDDSGSGRCDDGFQNGTETSVDCGGGCASCPMCHRCLSNSDCANDSCQSGRCEAQLTELSGSPSRVGTLRLFQREDGAYLIAHYAPGTYVNLFDPGVPQEATAAGGLARVPPFAPDPCVMSGHINYTWLSTTGRNVVLACGPDVDDVAGELASGLFNTTLSPGFHGPRDSSGMPGWAYVGPYNDGGAQAGELLCVSTAGGQVGTGGIAYCDGPGTAGDPSNNVISYNVVEVASGESRPMLRCRGMTCDPLAGCPFHFWVWLM